MSESLIVYNYNELGEPKQYIRFLSKSRSFYRTSFINERYNHCFSLLDSYIKECLKKDLKISEISIIEYAKFGFKIFENTFQSIEQESVPRKFINGANEIEISGYLKYSNVIKSSKVLMPDKHNWRNVREKNVDLAILFLLIHLRDYGQEKFEAVFGLQLNRINLDDLIDVIDGVELDYLMDNLFDVKHLFFIEKRSFIIYFACDEDYHEIIHEVIYKNQSD
jgi:hypothetical protein